jgi:CxxC motif-containing protein
MTDLVCIACPQGCRLKVDAELNVSGHSCERGEAYGRSEVQNPLRVVTSTVMVYGGAQRRCPVKTSGSIPKGLVIASVRALDGICLRAPIQAGQVVAANICGTGVDFVATRSIAAKADS